MTKKQMAKIKKSRKDNDALKTMDDLHVEAALEELYSDMWAWQARVKWIEGNIEIAKKEVAEFAAKLAASEDPLYEFKWADGYMDSAAKFKAYSIFLEILKNHGPDRAMQVAQEEAIRGAHFPERSTSTSSTYVATALTAAWAELVERDRWGF